MALIKFFSDTRKLVQDSEIKGAEVPNTEIYIGYPHRRKRAPRNRLRFLVMWPLMRPYVSPNGYCKNCQRRRYTLMKWAEDG